MIYIDEIFDPGDGIVKSELYIENQEGLTDITDDMDFEDKLGKIYKIGQIEWIFELVIQDNPNLKDISGFNKLNNVEYGITINLNPELTNISGFNGIEGIENLYIENNNKLKDISGFNGLEFVEELELFNNKIFPKDISKITGFKTLDEFRNVETILITLKSPDQIKEYQPLIKHFDNGTLNINMEIVGELNKKSQFFPISGKALSLMYYYKDIL